jgi:probable lipoprotein NlpC
MALCIGVFLMGFMTIHASSQEQKSLISERQCTSTEDTREFDEKIIREVKKYLGVPYKRGGSSRHGVDCSGFIRLIYRNVFCVELPYVASSQFTFPFLESISLRKIRTGDLVFFAKTAKKKRIGHVGIYLQGGNFAHALQKKGVIVSSLESPHWKARLVSAKRMTDPGHQRHISDLKRSSSVP